MSAHFDPIHLWLLSAQVSKFCPILEEMWPNQFYRSHFPPSCYKQQLDTSFSFNFITSTTDLLQEAPSTSTKISSFSLHHNNPKKIPNHPLQWSFNVCNTLKSAVWSATQASFWLLPSPSPPQKNIKIRKQENPTQNNNHLQQDQACSIFFELNMVFPFILVVN